MSRTLLGLALLTLLSVTLRTLQTYRGSIVDGQIVPYDPDAYVHLRRVELLLAGDIPPQHDDQFVTFPEKFSCPWAMGFTFLLAAIAKLLGATQPAQLASVCSFVIPFLGALAPLSLFWLLRRYHRGVAWTAAFALAVLPGSVMIGHFARIDHHVLEPAMAIVLFAVTPSLGPTWIFSSHRRAFLLGTIVAFVSAFVLHMTFGWLVLLAVLQGLAGLFLKRDTNRTSALAYLLGAALGISTKAFLAALLGEPGLYSPGSWMAAGLAYAAAGWFACTRQSPRFSRENVWALFSCGLFLAIAVGPALQTFWGLLGVGDASIVMSEAQPPWKSSTIPQALFHLVPAVLAIYWFGRAKMLPFTAYLGLLMAIYISEAKYQGLAAIAEACGWGVLPLCASQWTKSALIRTCLWPATGLAVLVASISAAPPNPALPEFAIARKTALLASQGPKIADPSYGVPHARPQYTLLAHPIDAARFGWFARMAVTAIPFWSQEGSRKQFESVLRLLRAPYSAATEAELERDNVRFILVAPNRPSLVTPAEQHSFYDRLLLENAAGIASLRLVAEVPPLKLFERVPNSFE